MKKRYPDAKHDVGGKMSIQGRYAEGHPRGAIVHFTAGGSDPVATVEGGIRNGYCFFVISPDGTVYQNFDLDGWGSHAGKSAHQKLGNSVSRFLVGIELCNAGKLTQIDADTFRPWFNDPDYYRANQQPIPAGVPKAGRDLKAASVRHVERLHNREAGWYHQYTAAQESALVKLLLWLKGNQPDVFQFEFVLGHDEVSPGRKNDPGGALSVTLPQFRERLVSMHGGKEAAPIVAEDPVPRALASTRLEFAPTRFFPEALAFQKAVNLFPGIKLTEDGYPGENTSAALQLLTGFYLKGDPRASDTPLLPINSRPVPVEAPEGSRRIKIGRQIVDWEARRDRQGRLTVYQLPGNDGGGNYEVAGINQRYHPQAARQLAELIESGNDQQAESVAAEYIASYTDAVARLVSNAGLEAFLRDSTFNRGLGGATKILQLALKVSVTGVIGQESRAALAKLEKVKPVELLKDLRAARETYERYYIGYRANFWQGLVNRWNKAHTFALSLLRSEEARSAAIEASLAQSREASVTMSPGGSNPVAEPLSPSLPPLCFDPSRDSIVTKRFQEFANSIAQLRLEEDGLAGEKTSDAFQRIFGYRLAGDPR